MKCGLCLWPTTRRPSVARPAMLTMDDDQHLKVGQYVEKIRPILDPLGSMENLLLLPGLQPIKQMQALLKRLERSSNTHLTEGSDDSLYNEGDSR